MFLSEVKCTRNNPYKLRYSCEFCFLYLTVFVTSVLAFCPIAQKIFYFHLRLITMLWLYFFAVWHRREVDVFRHHHKLFKFPPPPVGIDVIVFFRILDWLVSGCKAGLPSCSLCPCKTVVLLIVIPLSALLFPASCGGLFCSSFPFVVSSWGNLI